MEVRAFKRAAPEDTDAPLATAQIVLAAGAAVRRYDWYRERYYNEVLVIEEASVNLSRLQRGISLLNTHSAWDLEDVLGIIEDPTFDDGLLVCNSTFSRRQSVAGYVQDVADGVIRHVSVGYSRDRVEMVPPAEEGGLWTYRVTLWTPMEGSLVPIPADMDAQVRSAGGEQPKTPDGREIRTFPCDFIEVTSSQTRAAAQPLKDTTMTEAELQAQREQEAATARANAESAARAAAEAATQRSADITDLCQRHNLAGMAADFIRSNKPLSEVKDQVLAELAKRDGTGQQRNVHIQTVTDETQVRLAGIEEAITNRVDAKATVTENGRKFRGMSLLEIGREHLELSGVKTRGMSRMELATQVLAFRSNGSMTTSDFANLLANVANKRLRQAYVENIPSYQRWARRAPDAPDFKSMSVVQLGGAPDLLQTNEHGEFKYGAMTDGKETYSLLTYGRIVSLTRQALINDDLRAFDRLVGAFGNSAARLENRVTYAILTANANLADGTALFASGHANLAGSGAVIDVTTLKAGRTAMRLQKGYQSEELNLAPAFLIVPATQEQLAYQYTSANYVPATPANVNEFRAGGRTALEPIVEAVLDANSTTAWYLAANNGQVDTVEYCYLEGASGPVIESEMGFEVDGISYKARLDFAAKAIDYRGLYKNPGA